MKNTIKVLLTFVLTITALTSCFSAETPTDGNEKNDGNTTQTKLDGWLADDMVYYLGDTDIAFEDLQVRFKDEASINLSHETDKKDVKFFILGEYDSKISKSAYDILERNSDQDEYSATYTIYTDGTSVAIAYDSLVARWAAIDYFLTEFENLDLTRAGIVAVNKFDVLSYVDEKRTELRDEEFAYNVGGVLSTGAITSLKNMYSLYDEEIYIWLANLWDPDLGGFYYSNSARNSPGFLPDLESTAQALLFLSDSGMLSEYDNIYKDALSPDIANVILNFAKEKQSSEDGYFYHEQWGTSISVTRRGRDLGWAKRIISGFGSVPYWDTPDGVDGEYGAPGVSEASLTQRFVTSTAKAVSRVVPVGVPAYLTSVERFKEHLENDFDWETNSYAAGNTLESELGQIQNAGTEYTTALINFLNGKQKSNGLWEDEISYDSVNGLMKISVVYISLKAEFPNVDAAMECAIQVLKSNDKAAHVCSVYNPWAAVSNLLESVKRTSGIDAANQQRVRFRNEAEELIKITIDKLLTFKKEDGGFSYYIKYSAANSQGSPAAVPNTTESDVNATMICVNSIVTAMFDVFGIKEVARYGPVDFAYFSDTINSLGTIIKDEIPAAKPITFNDYDSFYGDEIGGVVTYPSGNVTNIVGDDEMFKNGSYMWFESSVTANPDPNASSNDLVLYAKSNVYVGEEKSLADNASSTRFKMPNAIFDSLGDCYVYDADMYFVSGYGNTSHTGKETSEPMLQLFFMTDSYACSGVNFSVYTDQNGFDFVKIGEAYGGLDEKDSNVAGEIPMDEWVNIRLEFYKNYSEDINGVKVYEPVLKVYVNGKYQGECDANITGPDSSGQTVYYDRDISLVSVSYYRYLASEVYFNDVLVERCGIKYVQETNPDAIVDPKLPDEEMRESYGFEDGLLNTSNVANKVRVYHFGVAKYINAVEGQPHNPSISYSITADPENAANHVLKVVALKSDEFDKPSRTEINLYNSSADGTDYIFSGRFYYSSADIGVSGDLTQLFIMNSTDGQAYSIRINAHKASGTLSLIENNIGTDKDTGTGETIAEGIECDKWFTLKIVFHGTKDAETTGADIYLNDKLVCRDPSYKAAALEQSPLVKVAIVHQKTNNSTLYLDDLSYAKSGEVIEQVESDELVATFTEGFDTKYVHSYSFNGSEEIAVTDIDVLTMEKLYTKFYLYTDPADATNRVLRAVNKNGGTNPGYTRVDIFNEDPKGNCYTFETKMYAETYKAGYNFACIKFMDKNGASAFSVYVSIDTTGKIKIASTGSGVYPAAGTNLLDGSDVSIAGKTWFTLRMEFYHEGESASKANTYLKVYVNDTLTYSGSAYGTLGAEIDYVKIEHCKTAQSSAIYYDDISFTRTNKKYTKD